MSRAVIRGPFLKKQHVIKFWSRRPDRPSGKESRHKEHGGGACNRKPFHTEARKGEGAFTTHPFYDTVFKMLWQRFGVTLHRGKPTLKLRRERIIVHHRPFSRL